uniref:Uncharacterized protein n=2 Tax=Timema TaxID=61471 RepID=A0A7R9H0M8_TIMPO|nr:unnamed protein product [Timema douglasi]CAD7404444.1 unnamed protein product [Timema poppensis]
MGQDLAEKKGPSVLVEGFELRVIGPVRSQREEKEDMWMKKEKNTECRGGHPQPEIHHSNFSIRSTASHKNMKASGTENGTSGFMARKSDHQITEVVLQ